MAGVDHLLAARRCLLSGIDKSQALATALDRTGPRLDDIRQRLPSLEAAVRPIRADREALQAVGAHIDRAVGPAAAVLKVYDAVHGLEPSLLSDPRADLPAYLSLLQRLEEAHRFLADSCGLAIQWLEDIVDYLGDNSVADDRYLSSLKKVLASLAVESGGKHSPPQQQQRLDGGLLVSALEKLEAEFRSLLVENSTPLAMPTTSGNSDPSTAEDANAISPSPLPVSVIEKLHSIIHRLSCNGRLDSCVRIYVDVRGSNVRASLRSLDLGYLELSPKDFHDVQSIEGHIVRWGRHLEFAVKHLFEAEYKLCSDVFERAGPPELWTGCFADIAAQAGILAFLRFGHTVTESKKDPIKLLKLLDIFTALNKLRLDFNRLFGGKACQEIQNLTRDLIKRLIDGVCEIFWELLVQVELQRQVPPPRDGGVPKLVTFITDYCNRLLSDEYRPVLMQVLTIHGNWKQESIQDRLLTDAILNIVKALEHNFDTWSKGYGEDVTLSYLFMMNTHWHFYKHLRGTALGELLGTSWLKEHEQYKEYYAAMLLRESWAKLPAYLSREGLILFSGGRATARSLVKKRLRLFNEAFEDMYKTQSNWVIPDKDLREKVWHLAIQAIVPVYRSYMQNYGPLVEMQDATSPTKYAKYTAESLEKMLKCLFLPKPGRSMSFRTIASHPNEKSNGTVRSLYQTPPTAISCSGVSDQDTRAVERG